MDTTSTDQSHAVMDMWSTVLTRYAAAMGLVVVLYDYLLTIEDEIRLVWPGGLNVPKVLYYLNRYLTITFLLFSTYEVAGFRPALSKRLYACSIDQDSACSPDLSCEASIFFLSVPLVTATIASAGLLTLRIAALYHNVRSVVWPLWLSFSFFQGLRVTIMLMNNTSVSKNMIPSPISGRCIIGNASFQSSALVIVPTLFDILLLVLTVFKAVTSPASLRANSIIRTLIRDEILFFCTISLLRITNAIIWLFLPPWWLGIVLYAEWGLDSAFTSRFFLNLRSIAYHQRTAVFETHARSFENPTVQPRPLRKLGRLWTNMFVDLDTDKTAYSRGTNPIEVNIEQVDEIDLDDIRSQADQQRK